MPVSLEELARLANTSVSTVSRALAGKPGVAEAKRENIRQLAQRLGYRPNQFARSLLSKRSHTLGFVTASLSNPIHMAFVSYIETAARDRGYEILIADSRDDVEREKENIDIMLRRQAEGLILFPVSDQDVGVDAAHLLELQLHHVPFVVAGQIEGYNFDCVTSEEFDAAKRLTRHLLDLGHQRLGVVAGNPKSRVVSVRFRGIEEALSEAGLTSPSALRRRTRPSELPRRWRGEVLSWLDEANPPTALICINQSLALRLIRPLKDRRLQIPGDVSLAAFGDSLWCHHAETTLTTMSPNDAEVARLIFETLMRRIDNPQAPPETRLVPQELHARESTAAPPALP
jgi:LacI family transcriptional regulator